MIPTLAKELKNLNILTSSNEDCNAFTSATQILELATQTLQDREEQVQALKNLIRRERAQRVEEKLEWRSELEKALDQVVGTSRLGDTAELSQVIRDLRSLGCECELCDETCPCSRQDRRCTPLCKDHVMETERECFEEPRSEESDYAGSSYEEDD